jgi:hypothetical protein
MAKLYIECFEYSDVRDMVRTNYIGNLNDWLACQKENAVKNVDIKYIDGKYKVFVLIEK